MKNEMNEEALAIEVFGRVQGVMFRQNVKEFAETIDLKGCALNKEDGSVFIFAQGFRKQLDELLFWLRKSPGLAKVEGISYHEKEIEKKIQGFKIIKESNFFSDQLNSFVNFGKSIIGKGAVKIPQHIAIIPDGNRRWAREKGFEASKGHLVSGEYENLKELMDEARNIGVKYISFWGFSTENWNRDKIEKEIIFSMIERMLPKLKDDFIKNKVKFRHLGRKDRLPKELVLGLLKLEKATEKNNDFHVQLCLDYGGRDEIMRAVNKAIEYGKEIDENSFKSFLDTKEIPDPELIIRTSGEQRTSGFMPFQSAYAEMYFTSVYFPDFDRKELRKAISSFGKRVRRFGGT